MPVPKRKKTGRACVIGLDGVPYGMIVELAQRGVMSTMARLMDIGKIHQMRASLPEISAVSWTDFMTGTDAGTHGIFGFTDFKPKSYAVRYPELPRRQGPDPLGQARGQGQEEHRHQPAFDLPRPEDRRRPHLRLRRPRAGQGRLADVLPGRPGADGLSDRRRHPQVPGEPRGPLAGAQQDHGRPPEGPELLLGGAVGLLRVRDHGHGPAPPFPLAGL